MGVQRGFFFGRIEISRDPGILKNWIIEFKTRFVPAAIVK
jgi:hypothetical protein